MFSAISAVISTVVVSRPVLRNCETCQRQSRINITSFSSDYLQGQVKIKSVKQMSMQN